MITRIHVKNFRSLADVDVELGPLTVLVGRNGAGKSAFLDVLRFVRDAIRSGLENAVLERHGIASLRRWAPRKPYNVEIGLVIQDRNITGDYSFTIASGQDGGYRVAREACSVYSGNNLEEQFEIRDGRWTIVPERYVKRPARLDRHLQPSALVFPLVSAFSPLYVRLRRSLLGNFYHIFPNTLREPQKPSNERLLADGGENFASVLREMGRSGTRFDNLVAVLRRVVDGVGDVRVQEVGGYLVTELRHDDLWQQRSSKKSPWFELAQESDGTLRILGILVALYQARLSRSMIALEEPENALHPGAVAILGEVAREAARRNQIILTTQSPDLISYFGINELRIVERIDGVTQVGRVEAAQREAINEQLFSAGDLLRIEGLHTESPLPEERPRA